MIWTIHVGERREGGDRVVIVLTLLLGPGPSVPEEDPSGLFSILLADSLVPSTIAVLDVWIGTLPGQISVPVKCMYIIITFDDILCTRIIPFSVYNTYRSADYLFVLTLDVQATVTRYPYLCR